MALMSEQFAAELKEMVVKRRAMYDHLFIGKFSCGALTRDQVKQWIEQQFYSI